MRLTDRDTINLHHYFSHKERKSTSKLWKLLMYKKEEKESEMRSTGLNKRSDLR